MVAGDPGKLIRLRNRHLEAWISPRHGAAIARLFEPDSGFEVLRTTSDDDVARGETMKFACFPMVPYSNRIGYRRMSFDGKVFELESNRVGSPHSFHGNAWMAEWKIDDASDDTLRVSHVHDAGDGHWPFPYRVEQSFTLAENTLCLCLRVRNIGEQAFPVGAGWHPYFTTDADSCVTFQAQQVWTNDSDMLPVEPVPVDGDWYFGKARPTRGLAIDNCFHGWEGKAILSHPARQRTVSISGCRRLSSLVVFRPGDGREFIAIEPVTQVNNGVNLFAQGRAGTGVQILRLDDSIEVSMEIRVART
jgi:aldose 1-epimerase